MAILIEAQNLSRGWLTALEALRQSGGKAVHLGTRDKLNLPVREDGLRASVAKTLVTL